MTPIVSEISFVVYLIGIFNFEIVVYPKSFVRKEGIGISEISVGDIYWISGIGNICRSAYCSDIRVSVCVISVHNIRLWKIGSIG